MEAKGHRPHPHLPCTPLGVWLLYLVWMLRLVDRLVGRLVEGLQADNGGQSLSDASQFSRHARLLHRQKPLGFLSVKQNTISQNDPL